VLDGGNVLKYGRAAWIQRYQVHQRRDVIDY
jgi:hypothetical protein